MKIYILVLLCLVCFSQKGRGGGSSSRSSSRSSFSSSRPIFTTVHSPMFVTTTRTRSTPSCIQQCHINFFGQPQLLAQCLAVCQQRSTRTMYGVLGFFGTIIVCCCGWACYQRLTQSSQNVQSPRSSVAGHPAPPADAYLYGGKLDRQKFILRTKDRLHNISTNYMTLDQFQLEKQIFQKQDWKMYYFHQNNEHYNDNVTFYFKAEQPFVYSMTCRGRDDVGSWGGNGYFICTNSGIQFWMLKDYDDREAAEQYGEYQLLMYEGHQVSKQRYEGTWYYVGFENTFDDSGKWIMVPRNAMTPSNPYVAQYF